MEVTDCIECPKCHKPFLKSCGTNSQFGKEYFCHFCHEYFGVNELVNQWNYDAGDLYPPYPVTHGNYKNWIPKGNYTYRVEVTPIEFFSPTYYEVETGEPYWTTENERKDSYQMVTRMLLDIPEFDDYADMLATHEDALEVGVQ